jgi:hypothetical protein
LVIAAVAAIAVVAVSLYVYKNWGEDKKTDDKEADNVANGKTEAEAEKAR